MLSSTAPMTPPKPASPARREGDGEHQVHVDAGDGGMARSSTPAPIIMPTHVRASSHRRNRPMTMPKPQRLGGRHRRVDQRDAADGPCSHARRLRLVHLPVKIHSRSRRHDRQPDGDHGLAQLLSLHVAQDAPLISSPASAAARSPPPARGSRRVQPATTWPTSPPTRYSGPCGGLTLRRPRPSVKPLATIKYGDDQGRPLSRVTKYAACCRTSPRAGTRRSSSRSASTRPGCCGDIVVFMRAYQARCEAISGAWRRTSSFVTASSRFGRAGWTGWPADRRRPAAGRRGSRP